MPSLTNAFHALLPTALRPSPPPPYNKVVRLPSATSVEVMSQKSVPKRKQEAADEELERKVEAERGRVYSPFFAFSGSGSGSGKEEDDDGGVGDGEEGRSEESGLGSSTSVGIRNSGRRDRGVSSTRGSGARLEEPASSSPSSLRSSSGWSLGSAAGGGGRDARGATTGDIGGSGRTKRLKFTNYRRDTSTHTRTGGGVRE